MEHWLTVASWKEARAALTFQPLEARHTAGLPLQSLRIHVRDHKSRELAIEHRTLEAHYGRFVFSQAWKGAAEARRLALDVSYGLSPRDTRIAGRAGRLYELGPEPPPDDIDGRSPAVVTWADGDMFYLIASGELSANEILEIASALYRR